MSLAHEPIFLWMSQFAYQPTMVYAALVGMMLLSSFGFPLPEEVTLLSVGLLAFFGQHPELFPPPFAGAPVVQTHTAMWVATLAVFGSDVLVFSLGRVLGRNLLEKAWLRKVFPEKHQKTIEYWTRKYGAYTCAIFRFTPGVRFPGHLAYGMMKFPLWKFAAIDGLAVLVSVPTQIYLMATYGEQVLVFLRRFKIGLGVLLGLVLFIWMFTKWKERWRRPLL
ncbi:MAG: VTT domain-containing protein [Bdellovibrionaceae bacterium]|jgi:membrane protein DedA with SNARE-associated domain|nr:VTT domain-containing protein [Pseudobdellovibrionaceae bacterium]